MDWKADGKGKCDGSLAFAGAGLRVDMLRRVGATAKVAVPLIRPRSDTNRGPRINLGISTAP